MRRMVVCTAQGVVVTESDVEEHKLFATMSTWVQMLPDAGIYIDGVLIPEELRAMLKLGTPAPASPSRGPLPEPEKLRGFVETMQLAFDDVRKFQVQAMRDFLDCAKQFSDMWLEREQQFADEAARQRQLTQKSLADVDLLGRSVKAVQLQELLAGTGANTSARARQGDGVAVVDVVSGLLDAINGKN